MMTARATPTVTECGPSPAWHSARLCGFPTAMLGGWRHRSFTTSARIRRSFDSSRTFREPTRINALLCGPSTRSTVPCTGFLETVPVWRHSRATSMNRSSSANGWRRACTGCTPSSPSGLTASARCSCTGTTLMPATSRRGPTRQGSGPVTTSSSLSQSQRCATSLRPTARRGSSCDWCRTCGHWSTW